MTEQDSTLVLEKEPVVVRVTVRKEKLIVDLDDGRSVHVPLKWYPRLAHATSTERNSWRFIAGGRDIHWPALDEDISVENLLCGKSSGESQTSFKRWLTQRTGKKRGLRRNAA